MSLYINKLNKDEIITSYNFARNSDFVYSEIVSKEQYKELKNEYTEIIEEDEYSIFYKARKIDLKENDVIFCNTYFLKSLFNDLRNVRNLKNLKLITNQTDQKIDRKLFNKKPNCISRWYGINIEYNSSDLIPIPLGMSNNWSPKNLMKSHYELLNNADKKIDKVYVNFEVNTNFFHRNRVLNYLSRKDWFNIEKTKLDLFDYLVQMNKYKYTLCPLGNGYDTHRLWEALYAQSVPIIFTHQTYKSVEGLPVIKIDTLNDLNEATIKKKFRDLSTTNYEKLNINWWINKINEEKIDNKETYQSLMPINNMQDSIKEYRKIIKRLKYQKKISTNIRKAYKKLV